MGDRNANSHSMEQCVSRTTDPETEPMSTSRNEDNDQSASVESSVVLLEGSVELERLTEAYWLTVIVLAISVMCIAGVVLFLEVV